MIMNSFCNTVCPCVVLEIKFVVFVNKSPGVRFLKVPMINGPGKLYPFTLKSRFQLVLHLA